MTEQQITAQPKNGLTQWGSRDEVKEIAARLKRFVPGTKDMNDDQVMAYAQLVHMTGLNPRSGELHGWDSKGSGTGNLITKLGYGILVRWAQSQEPFTTRFTAELDDEENITARCRLLRQSARPLLGQLLAGGAPYEEALDWATTEGIGIVTKTERWSKKYNKQIDPPKSKSWKWKAEKRALEDAIRRAYGTPSTQELAAQTWIVDGVKTIANDWGAVTPEMLPAERQATAKLSAQHRLNPPQEERSAAKDIEELYGPDPDAKPAPEPEPEQETEPNGLDTLLTEVNARLIENTLEPYQSKENMIQALKAIGHRKYSAESHATMVSQLIAKREPNGKKEEA